MTIRCAFDGCHKKTEQPSTDGWAYLCKYGPGIKDGSYCPAHADAIECIGNFQRERENDNLENC